MRLGTWNCEKDIAKHWDALEALDVDVIAVQECGNKTEEEADKHGWGCVWGPGTPRQ